MDLAPSNDAIEQRAYELWEKAGSPEGRELEFWLKAEQESQASPSVVPPIIREGEPPD